MCAGCVIREECLEYALAAGERFGIWGGVSERERRRIRGRRRELMVAAQPCGCDHGGIDELDQAHDVTPPVDGPSGGSARVCAVCANELPANRQKTCGPECAARYKHRSNPKPAERALMSAGGNGTGTIAWQPLRALLAYGAQLEEVRLTMDGQPWTLARSTNGASP